MIEVIVRDNTDAEFDKAVKLFKKKVNESGHLRELTERRYYIKPSMKKRKKLSEELRGQE